MRRAALVTKDGQLDVFDTTIGVIVGDCDDDSWDEAMVQIEEDFVYGDFAGNLDEYLEDEFPHLTFISIRRFLAI